MSEHTTQALRLEALQMRALQSRRDGLVHGDAILLILGLYEPDCPDY
jgi:hypothetical protein